MKKVILTIIFLLLFIPALSFADLDSCINNAGTSAQLCNPAARASVDEAVKYAINFMAPLLIAFAVTYVIFAGFRMVISQGNQEQLDKAKSGLQWSLLGIVLILLSYVIIVVMQKYIGIKEGALPMTLDNPLEPKTFGHLIERMMTGFMSVAGILTLLMIIISGYRYLTAGVNEEQAEQAKTSLQWSVLGLIVILLAYVIVVASAKLFTTVTQ